jgi:Carbohydrate-selective porin, OprB family
MDRVNELIAAATADMASKEDLATLQKLQEEFAAELATLRGRVDAVEAKVATLEKQQFSTTTKLQGEVAFSVADSFGDNDNTETVLQNRMRLQLVTSFTGKDKLFTRLAAGNLGTSFAAQNGTQEGRFAYDGQTNNDVVIDRLHYVGDGHYGGSLVLF